MLIDLHQHRFEIEELLRPLVICAHASPTESELKRALGWSNAEFREVLSYWRRKGAIVNGPPRECSVNYKNPQRSTLRLNQEYFD